MSTMYSKSNCARKKSPLRSSDGTLGVEKAFCTWQSRITARGGQVRGQMAGRVRELGREDEMCVYNFTWRFFRCSFTYSNEPDARARLKSNPYNRILPFYVRTERERSSSRSTLSGDAKSILLIRRHISTWKPRCPKSWKFTAFIKWDCQ